MYYKGSTCLVCRVKVFCHLLCVRHLSRGGQYVVDDQTVPRCAHKMEVVRTRKELGLKASSETGKGSAGSAASTRTS